jgi:para-aminobenzoate synthetase component I
VTPLPDGAHGAAGLLGGPLVEELIPIPDPLDALERFHDLPFVLLLDSASDPERLGRYSFLMADPSTVVVAKDGRTIVQTSPAAAGTTVADDPLLTVRSLLAPFASEPVDELPPFQGGAAGYIGYEYGAWLERLPRPRYDDLDVPDVMLGLYDWVLSWDHRAGRAWLLSTGAPELHQPSRQDRARRRLDEVRRRLGAPARPRPSGREFVAPPRDPAVGRPTVFPAPGRADLGSSFSREGYLRAVARVREYILAGDIFQANLSQRFEAPFAGHSLSLYRRLRELNPAPFAAYFKAPEFAVVSASPERFIRVEVGGAVEARPIKGTTPRGISPEHDAHLGRALTESEKDRAENLMIVDLLRNDLSRLCRPGTVRVPELFALEHYSTVHHLVSTVVGELVEDADAIDLLRAAFPGGSITGAPKVRAMEIIAELEPSRRGVYCGAVGYLSGTTAADTSIVIRTYLVQRGRVYFSAGGGIVADSEPAAEYDETLDKARALIAALDDCDARPPRRADDPPAA